ERRPVFTYGVALAPSVPRVNVAVPGGDGTVTIQPACRNREPNPDGNCAIVDFKIVSQELVDVLDGDGTSVPTRRGKLYVNWEDSEQGGDFDQDMWGVIDYEVTSTSVSVTTNVIAQSTPNSMGFVYIISGTTLDGFHVHSGINNFNFAAADDSLIGCSNCTSGNSATTNTFTIGTSSAQPLEQPLYYAAKWGGYPESDDGEELDLADIAAQEPGTYYPATDPRQLQASLRDA